MDTEKRNTIIKEIEHWRRSRLLPEQYCVFLLNLYRDDPNDQSQKENSQSTAKGKAMGSWRKGLYCLAIIAIISSISFYVYDFTSFSIGLQMSIPCLFILICYIFGTLKRKSSPLLSYLLVGFGSVFLLFIGEYLLSLNGITEPIWIIGYVVLCSLVWLIAGFALDIGMMQFAGWIGLILFYGFLLHFQLDTRVSWLIIQLCWVPLGLIFAWMGWLIHKRANTAGKVLISAAVVLWFAAEFFSLFSSDISGKIIQFSVIGKVIILAITVFLSRKKWMDLNK